MTDRSGYLSQIKTLSSELVRLMSLVSSETNSMKAKLDGYSERLEVINKRPGPHNIPATDRIMSESASDFNLYAAKLEETVPGFEQHTPRLTDAYSQYVRSLDLEAKEDQDELAGINREIADMPETFRGVRGTLMVLRAHAQALHQHDYSASLNQAASRLLEVIDKLIPVYGEFETFALTLQHTANEKGSKK